MLKGATDMKMKKAAAALIAAMLATSSLSLSAFAAEEEDGFEKKSVKAYFYSKDDSKDLDCLFTKANSELPYLKVEDFLDSIFTVDFDAVDKGNGVYEITGNDGAMTVDTEKDTVTVKNYERLTTFNSVPSKNLGGKYAKEKTGKQRQRGHVGPQDGQVGQQHKPEREKAQVLSSHTLLKGVNATRVRSLANHILKVPGDHKDDRHPEQHPEYRSQHTGFLQVGVTGYDE